MRSKNGVERKKEYMFYVIFSKGAQWLNYYNSHVSVYLWIMQLLTQNLIMAEKNVFKIYHLAFKGINY